MKEPDFRLNEIRFLNNTVKASNSEENIGGIFSKSINSLISSTNQKLSASTDNEEDCLSMIYIPDDDPVMKEENSQNCNISVQIRHKDVAVSEHKTKASVVQSNKMYANDVSSSSSSDNDDAPEIIRSIKNPEKILSVSKQCIRTNESARNDDVRVFINDILSERLI